MVDQPLVLDPSYTPEALSLDSSGNPVSPEVANKRAYKIASGNSLPDKTYEEVHQGLMNGDEMYLRDQAAYNKDIENKNKRAVEIAALAKISPEKLLENDVFTRGTYPVDPLTIFEKNYADSVVNEVDKTAERTPGNPWTTAMVQSPKYLSNVKAATSDVIAKRNIAVTMKEDVEDQIQQMGFGWGFFSNIAPTLFQGYQEYNLRGLVPGTSFFKGGLGANLEEQRKELYNERTPEDFAKRLKSIVDPLREQNPFLAQQFLEAVVGQSTDNISVNNAFTAMGIFDVLGASKLGLKGVKALRGIPTAVEVKQVAKDIIESTKGTPTVQNKIAATGDVGEAAVQETKFNLTSKLTGSHDAIKSAVDYLPSGLKTMAEDVKANPGSLSNSLVNMLIQNFDTSADRLMTTIANLSKVRRIPLEQATDDVLRRLKDEAKDNFPTLSNAILNVSDPFYNPVTNTYHYDLQIGNHGSQLFRHKNIAENFAKVNGIEGAKIVPQGLGYYIRVTKPVDENSNIIRDLLLVPQGRIKKNWANATLGWLRTTEDTVSFNERVQRKVATYAQGELRKLEDAERAYLQRLKNGGLDDITGQQYNFISRKLINGVNYFGSKLRLNSAREKWMDLERVLEHNQKMLDPDTNLQGYFFKGPGELQSHYLTNFGRSPDFDEVQAYFAHKRLWEYDYALRNLRIYTNKARLGAENFGFHVLDKNGNKIEVNRFDGVQRNVIPRTDDVILIVGSELGNERLIRGNMMGKTLHKDLDKRLKEGRLKLVEVFAPERRPFEGFGAIGSQRIRYVISEKMSQQPLSYKQLERRGGGHYEYDHDFYIKQASIRPEKLDNIFKHWYEGDTTVLGVSIRAKGNDLTKKMNDVRELLALKQDDAARKLLERTLPFEWDEFRGWFHAKGGKKPLLDLHEPFMLVPKDRKILDMGKDLERRYPSTFKDGTREGSLSNVYQVKFTGERDAEKLRTIKDVGTRDKPIYKLSDADLVDPIPMMNRALARITNTSLMDDFKIASTERWIRDAAEYLDYKDSELRHAPFYYFNNPKWKAGTPLAVRWSLMNNHFKIKQFTGLPNYVDTALHSAAQSLSDWTYRALGGYEGEGQAFKRGLALAPGWLLTRVTDPISFVRGMVFHFKLGLFAVPQILVQNMTYMTIAALSPKNVLQGASAALLHHWTSVNDAPQILKHLDRMASKLGWKPGEWLEANAELKKTGFGHVGGEFVNLDNLSNYKVVKNAGQDFLDWGQFFFKAGEKNVRYGAWYTAFKEYRRANPFGRITVADREKILERADNLYTNMSRASASTLHTGPLSLTTQFLSYQLRLAELFFSKRIGDTVPQRVMARARIAAVYAASFGVPSAVGVTGLPLADYLRKEAIKSGYVVGDNWLTGLMEGLPAYLMAWVSGGGDAEKGNQFNFGERYGAPGFDQLKQVLRGDIPWYHIIGGAAFSVLSNMIESMDPMFKWIGTVARDEHKYPLRKEDLLAPLTEIQSVNMAKHLYEVYNVGKWLSKKGVDLGDATMGKAVFMAATGLQDQRISDTYLKLDIKREREQKMKDAVNKAVIQLRNSFQASKDNNPSAAEDYYRRAFSGLRIAGFPEEKDLEVIGKAREQLGSFMDDVDYTFYTKNVPESARLFGLGNDPNHQENMQDAYSKILKREFKKGN